MRSTQQALNRRTMDEIQRYIIKRGKRNLITRLSRGNDKEAIATWTLEFNETLHIFNVRSVTPARSLLTSRFQTELVANTRPTVSDTRHDAANIHTATSEAHHDTTDADDIVPDVRHDIPHTHHIDSNIHREKLKSREDGDGQKQAVSITHTLTFTEWLLTVA
jgi:hypothetical protein